MSRWRTHHNRRRSRQIKAGGLYTLQLLHDAHGVTWSALGDTLEYLRAQIAAACLLPAAYLSKGERL
jgi:hypothetical protein